MLGSIFRLVSIDQNDRGIWIVRLTLCNNSDPDLQAVFDYMKDQYGNGETTILSLGLVLAQMGKNDEAEKYYRSLLKEINPTDYEDISACYHNLGNLFDDKGDYQLSLDWHHKALESMIKIFRSDDSIIATSFNSIAAIHSKMNNYDEALDCYLKALKIWKQALGEEHPTIGQCLNALHNNIGAIHLSLDHLDHALEHLNMSLNIKKKCLPSQHPDIAMTFTNIGLIYESKTEWQQAVSYLEKAVNIYRHVLHPNHPILIEVEQLLARVSSKSKMT
ncbi:unnamed protein product [Rotaria sp. Silwood1]|nr:unnamed protein product [Rotaria sp. Silwood1]